MIAVFVNEYVHGRPLVWFDSELKVTLGVDVYQHAFDPAKGYATIRERNVEVLIIQAELDDTTKARAIAEFLGIAEFQLVRSNVSSRRPHADAYAKFQQRIRVPDTLMDAMYNSKYARHFYSDEKREQCRARWQGRSSSSIAQF
jgi:hypothetical protein